MNAQEAIKKREQSSADSTKPIATGDSYLNWLRRCIQTVRQMPKELPVKKSWSLTKLM